jgi:hypothetical protein
MRGQEVWPLSPEEAAVLYANGFWITSTAIVSGSILQSGTLLPQPVVKMGGVSATVQFAGLVTPRRSSVQRRGAIQPRKRRPIDHGHLWQPDHASWNVSHDPELKAQTHGRDQESPKPWITRYPEVGPNRLSQQAQLARTALSTNNPAEFAPNGVLGNDAWGTSYREISHWQSANRSVVEEEPQQHGSRTDVFQACGFQREVTENQLFLHRSESAQNHRSGAPPPASKHRIAGNWCILSSLATGWLSALMQAGGSNKMKNKLRLLAVALAAGGTMFAQSRLSIGIGMGYGPGSYSPPAYSQRWRAPVNNYRTAPPYVDQRDDNAYREYDRDDRGRELDRGYDNQYQSRGSERVDSRSNARFDSRSSAHVDNRGSDRSDNRSRAYSNDFRR